MAEGCPVVAPTTENQKKRRRDADDHSSSGPTNHSDRDRDRDRIPQPPPPHSGNATPINYLSKATTTKLPLFQNENEAFSDILSLIGEYEGVLSRHESLAANLGAKLTSPRLLRAVESLFEGSIVVSPLSPLVETYSPSWLEIANFAASNPAEFNLTTTPDGRRVCQFAMKNVRVEIGEDDWRLIMSGALDRFRLVPPQPLEEDAIAELATLDILEKRLQTLIKEADEVARKARQLNYHLSGRKAAINSRRSSPQGLSAPCYPPMNQPPKAAPAGPNPAYDLHADLLQQFLASTHQNTSSVSSGLPPLSSGPPPSEVPRPLGISPGLANSQAHILTPNSRHSPAYSATSPTRKESTANEEQQAPYRTLIQSRVEELAKGDRIVPPCDRCRRLKAWCIKHLTSCQGCTRKHAKCTWKSVTDDEIDMLRGELSTHEQAREGAAAPKDRRPAAAEAEHEHEHEQEAAAAAGKPLANGGGGCQDICGSNEAAGSVPESNSLILPTETDVNTDAKASVIRAMETPPPPSLSLSTQSHQYPRSNGSFGRLRSH